MKNSHPATDTNDAFLTDLKDLVGEAQKLLDAPKDGAHDIASSLRERFEAAQDRFNDIYATAKKKVVAGGKYTDKAIRENPYQSIAIAAGVGLLAGILIGRRK
jgi:ElaB/YqjD/DUF883 family membrane-anchored ribosome-binding protein